MSLRRANDRKLTFPADNMDIIWKLCPATGHRRPLPQSVTHSELLQVVFCMLWVCHVVGHVYFIRPQQLGDADFDGGCTS